MIERAQVFLDTSALLAGIWSSSERARMILRLAEMGAIQVWISHQVLSEIEEVMREKAPESLGHLAILLDRLSLQIVPSATRDLEERCQTFVSHPGDARILADALVQRVDYFITVDREHFLDKETVRGIVLFSVGSPEELLGWLREKYNQ